MSGKLSSWRFSNPDLRQIYSRCRETLHNFQNLTALSRLHRATPRQTLVPVFADDLDEAGTQQFLARHLRMRGFSLFFRRFKAHVLALPQTDKRVCAELYAPSIDKSRCNDRSQQKSSRLDEAKHQYQQLKRQLSRRLPKSGLWCTWGLHLCVLYRINKCIRSILLLKNKTLNWWNSAFCFRSSKLTIPFCSGEAALRNNSI